MESTNSKNAKPENIVIEPNRFQSKAQEVSVSSENSNPNVSHAKSSKSTQKITKSKLNPSQAVYSPRNRIRERRFVVVKKKNSKEEDSASVVAEVDCKCGAKTNGNMKKCVCVAYETLRASHEEFFKTRRDSEADAGESVQNVEEEDEVQVGGESDEIGVSSMKRRREKVLEEARRSIPEYGKVIVEN